MIKHMVCFKLKEPTPELLEETKNILLSMKGKVESLIDLEVGIDFLHSERSYDIVLLSTHENKDALEAYQNDPYHCDVVKAFIANIKEASVAVDYIVE